MKLRFFLIPLAFSSALAAPAPETILDPAIAAYRPGPTVAGELRAWGYRSFKETFALWSERFGAHYPGIRPSAQLFPGTSPGNAALMTGVAELALFGREIRPNEVVSFGRVFPYEQLAIRVAGGAFDAPNKTPALGVYVHRDNPLAQLSLTQLDAIYSAERLRGAPAAITRWGQLGLTGEWAEKLITIYGIPKPFGTAEFVRLRAFNDGNWAPHVKLPPGSPTKLAVTAGEEFYEAMIKALEADRYAIGFLIGHYATPKVKPLALAERDGGPFFDYTRANVIARDYPLGRIVYIVVNKDPTKPWDPRVREFLSFVLSREGQEAVVDAGVFTPLPETVLKIERAKLNP